MTAAGVAALAGAAGYAGLLATTRPFTLPADVVTAAAVIAGAGALAHRLASRPAPATVGGAGAGGAAPWMVLLALIAGWELFCFFGGPRPAHPTVSSLYDDLARLEAAKAVVVLLWLGLGWELVRR